MIRGISTPHLPSQAQNSQASDFDSSLSTHTTPIAQSINLTAIPHFKINPLGSEINHISLTFTEPHQGRFVIFYPDYMDTTDHIVQGTDGLILYMTVSPSNKAPEPRINVGSFNGPLAGLNLTLTNTKVKFQQEDEILVIRPELKEEDYHSDHVPVTEIHV